LIVAVAAVAGAAVSAALPWLIFKTGNRQSVVAGPRTPLINGDG
jgi:hypothetical protein